MNLALDLIQAYILYEYLLNTITVSRKATMIQEKGSMEITYTWGKRVVRGHFCLFGLNESIITEKILFKIGSHVSQLSILLVLQVVSWTQYYKK